MCTSHPAAAARRSHLSVRSHIRHTLRSKGGLCQGCHSGRCLGFHQARKCTNNPSFPTPSTSFTSQSPPATTLDTTSSILTLRHIKGPGLGLIPVGPALAQTVDLEFDNHRPKPGLFGIRLDNVTVHIQSVGTEAETILFCYRDEECIDAVAVQCVAPEPRSDKRHNFFARNNGRIG